MEKVMYDTKTYLYRDILNLSDFKDEILKKCNEIIESLPNVTQDGYGYFEESKDLNFIGEIEIKNKLDEILKFGIQSCIDVYQLEYNLPFNKISTDCWVNVVRAKNPVQFDDIESELHQYHIHTEINEKNKKFIPHFTWVYYIQMPDNLKDDDGTLYIKGENDIEYFILPKEGDFIIMKSDLPHSPQHALDSTKDRMVLAGNVGFEFIKKQKSLI
jgi:hypothetical protein